MLLQQQLILQKHVHGNSATAAKLQTARNIAISGAVKGSANFDGSGNVIITTSQNNIFVLTGNIKMPSANSNSLRGGVEIDYPSRFK